MTTFGDLFENERKKYLRVGDWHPSETSRNYATGKTEKGVSVYDLHPDTGHPIAPPKGDWAEQDMHDRLNSDHPKYVVTGKKIGHGNDGEPLLKKIQIVGEWKPRT